MKKKSKKFIIARLILLFIFIGINIFLIIESLTPQDSSSKQSNGLGNVIVDVVNGMGGDQATIIEPSKVNIKNKISNANTLDKLTLDIETLPEDTRYKSYTYKSSNLEVATIDEFGNVEFIKEGEVDLFAYNTFSEEIFDSFHVRVTDIYAESMEVEIKDVAKEDDIYTLYLGEVYTISSTVLPENRTSKDILYECRDNPYIKINNDQINVIKESLDSVIDIHVQADALDEVLHVKTKTKPIEYIPLESITIFDIKGYENSNISIVNKLEFNPSDATNKSYEIVEILDNSIATINTQRSIQLLSEGTTKIKIKAIDLDEIFTGNIIVLKRPDLVDFNATVKDSSIYVNETKKIKLSNPSPKDSMIQNVSYESLNPSLLSVTSNGYVKGLSIGTGQIKVTSSGIEKILEIEVLPSIEETTDFIVDYIKGESPYVEVSSIHLNDYFKASSFIPHAPIKKDMTYEVISGNAKVDGSILNIYGEGKISLLMIHKSSGVSKTVDLYAYYPLAIDDDIIENTLVLNQEYVCSIHSNSIYSYHVEVSNKNISYIQNENEVIIQAKNIGNTTLSFYPILEDKILYDAKIEYPLSIIHKDTKNISIDINIKPQGGNLAIYNNPDILNLYKSDKITYQILLDSDITRKSIQLTSSNSSCIKVSNNNLLIVGIGDTILNFKEEYSNLNKTIRVHVSNLLSLNEENNLKITGNYTKNEDSITIVNGEAITIKYNFTKYSTIQSTIYSSSDLSVAKIGDDGVITPMGVGDTIITLEVKDSSGTLVKSEVKLIVRQKDFVENISDFIYIYVRKGLGHFGIFLILAIFASLCCFMFFENKKWWHVAIKIGIIFVYGFLFAGLTELLQLITPGRCGLMRDVLVDFSGYSLAAVLLSIGFIIFFIIKRKKNKCED